MARYALLIGNSQYPEEPGLDDLRFPERDVDALASVLDDPEHGGFEKVLAVKNETHHVLLARIHRLLVEAGRDHLALIYFSGHGLLDDAGQLYLATVDTTRRWLATSAVAVNRIRELVDQTGNRRAVLILDCCHAGAAGHKGEVVDETLRQASGERENTGRGIYILAASTAIQTAREKETDDNGLYTKHLVAGIRTGEADLDQDGWVGVDELHRYVREQVLAERPSQEPRFWGLDVGDPLLIARSRFRPREQRAEAIRQRLLELAAQDYIDDDLLTDALRIARQPVEALDENAARKDRLLDDLLDDSLKPAALLRAWLRADGGDAAPRPEPVAADRAKGGSGHETPETESPAEAQNSVSWFERLKPVFFVLAVVGIIAGIIIEDIFFDRAEMPDFTGARLDEIRTTLDEKRWQYNIRRHFNPTVDSGTVLDQDPPAGTTIKPSEERILLIVAESATVPDLVNLKPTQARELLALRGLVLAEPETRIDKTRRVGIILEQNPPPGRKVEPGTAVRVVVNRPSDPPDFYSAPGQELPVGPGFFAPP